MDAARGFALLGIFLVNMRLFSQPSGAAYAAVPPEGTPPVETAAFYFLTIFCEGKFYPLFAALFGMGIAAQFARARSRGAPFAAVQVRRLALLAVVGAAHATLLWYGDILFAYAVAGLGLVMFAFAPARALVISGAVLAVFGALLTGALVLLTAGAAGQPAVVEEAVGEEAAQPPPPEVQGPREGPVLRLMDALADGRVQSPVDPEWMALETEAFREGG
jgi:uncharacterized protein